MTLVDTDVGNLYHISERIGAGAFGEIYRGVEAASSDEVALKVEDLRTKSPQLHSESKVYATLAGGPGVPHMHWFGISGKHSVMAMDLLGKSLADLCELCSGTLSIKTVLTLADQMISCVQFVHEKNFVHRDIKPENFVMGANLNSNLVYLIDYGLARHYRDPRSHVHIPYKDGRGLSGTARYSSLNALAGVEQSRRDDMEALGYLWIHLLKGRLPWQGVRASKSCKRRRIIKEMKEATRLEELCTDMPQEFVEYMYSVRQLRFGDRPNYETYRANFRRAFIREGMLWDYKYDWYEQMPIFRVCAANRQNSAMVPCLVEVVSEARSARKQPPRQPKSRLARLAVAGSSVKSARGPGANSK